MARPLPFIRGTSLSSLLRSVDEQFMGSFAGIAPSLIDFYRKTELSVYIGIAETLESLGGGVMEEAIPPSAEHPCASVETLKGVVEKASIALLPLTHGELMRATQLVKGHSVVEVPSKWNNTGDAAPDTMGLTSRTSVPRRLRHGAVQARGELAKAYASRKTSLRPLQVHVPCATNPRASERMPVRHGFCPLLHVHDGGNGDYGFICHSSACGDQRGLPMLCLHSTPLWPPT
jgi:hypothetical protein